MCGFGSLNFGDILTFLITSKLLHRQIDCSLSSTMAVHTHNMLPSLIFFDNTVVSYHLVQFKAVSKGFCSGGVFDEFECTEILLYAAIKKIFFSFSIIIFVS
jgi:hypothetical protein